jgi:hypothetical protein
MGVLNEGVIQPDGGLYDLGWYLAWTPGDKRARLDGEFTAQELRAIADHMVMQELAAAGQAIDEQK